MIDAVIKNDVTEMINSHFEFNKLYGKTVLISGANGYVPAYFIHLFMGLNDEEGARIKVIALCRNEDRAKGRFAAYEGRNDLTLLIQDVCEPIDISESVHYFIHAAGPAGVNKRYENLVNTFDANVLGAKNMLECAKKHSCEGFLMISSIDIYGASEEGKEWKENDTGILDPLNIRNIYASAKRAAETLCIAYKEQYGLPVKIVRPVQIIGPGLELNDGRLHIDFISQILKKGKIVLKSDGSAKRSFIYITDAIMAMLTVMLRGKVGEAYNVSTDSGEATVLELAQIMANVSGNDVPIEFDIKARSNIEVTAALPVMVSDSSKIKSSGWTNRIGIEEACRRMFAYYSELGRGTD